jgi:hypothetical protein
MAERSNAAVSKTVVLARVPGVRIPLSPQIKSNPTNVGFVFYKRKKKTCFRNGAIKRQTHLVAFYLSHPIGDDQR